MDLDPADKSQLTKEILLGFHVQFAENQRNREQSFLKMLAFLAVPVVGFAYAYHYYFHPTEEFKIGPPELYFVHVIAQLLLFAGVWTTVVISNNFRRDQYVISRIRELCDVIGSDRVFPTGYNPKTKIREWGLFTWMPDFLLVFFALFVIVQFILLIVFLDGVGLTCVGISERTDWRFSISILISIGLVLGGFLLLPWKYKSKLLKELGEDKNKTKESLMTGQELPSDAGKK